MTLKRRPSCPAADSQADSPRRLVHVPILHSPADMGTLAEGMAAAIIDRLGRRHWDEYLSLIEGFWEAVRAELEGLGLDYSQVDLYQDGLPVCGREREIVENAAAGGSENHQLLLDLMARGADLFGTEDLALLLQEYRDVKTAIEGRPGAGRGPQTRFIAIEGPVLPAVTVGAIGNCAGGTPATRVKKRDAFIGRRIGESLRPGRTGILFLGMLHDVEPHLPTDIVVTRLVPHGLKREVRPIPCPQPKQPL